MEEVILPVSVAGAYMRNSGSPRKSHICTFLTSSLTVGSSGSGEIAYPDLTTPLVYFRGSSYQARSSELSSMDFWLAASASKTSSSYASVIYSAHVKFPPSCHLSFNWNRCPALECSQAIRIVRR